MDEFVLSKEDVDTPEAGTDDTLNYGRRACTRWHGRYGIQRRRGAAARGFWPMASRWRLMRSSLRWSSRSIALRLV